MFKYITTLFGDTIKATNKTLIGGFALLALEKNTYENRHPEQVASYQDLTDHIYIQISKWQFERMGFEVNPVSVYNFNKLLESCFDYELYAFCRLHVRYDVEGKVISSSYKTALEAFAEHYGLEMYADVGASPDITYDALKQKEFRYRRKMNEKKTSYSSAIFK